MLVLHPSLHVLGGDSVHWILLSSFYRWGYWAWRPGNLPEFIELVRGRARPDSSSAFLWMLNSPCSCSLGWAGWDHWTLGAQWECSVRMGRQKGCFGLKLEFCRLYARHKTFSSSLWLSLASIFQVSLLSMSPNNIFLYVGDDIFEQRC